MAGQAIVYSMHARSQILPKMAVSVSTSLSSSEIARSAAASLGYSSLKPEQLLATSSFLEGNYVFVSLPTGYGKSLCYAALPPALTFEPLLGLFHTITRDAVACVLSKVSNIIYTSRVA